MPAVVIVGAFARGAAHTNRAQQVAEGFAANGYTPAFFDIRPKAAPAVVGFACAVADRDPASDLQAHLKTTRPEIVFVMSAPSDIMLSFARGEHTFCLVQDVVEDPLGLFLTHARRAYLPTTWLPLAHQAREVLRTYRGLWNIADVVCVISNQLRETVRAAAPARPVVYLPILAATADASNQAADVSSQTFSYCGSLSFTKDAILTLLLAARELKARGVSATFDLFGFGRRMDVATLELFIRLWRLQNSVRWRGFVSEAELETRLASSAGLILTKGRSRQNLSNFSTRLVDYLKARRPVIMSDVGEAPRHFVDRQTAFLVPPGDHKALASAVEFVINYPADASQVGRAGSRLLVTTFNASQRIRDLVDTIQQLRSRPVDAANRAQPAIEVR